MQCVLKVIFAVAVISGLVRMAVAVLTLLNVTAPNPTDRRTPSQMPITL
jgi:hypothetical protein